MEQSDNSELLVQFEVFVTDTLNLGTSTNGQLDICNEACSWRLPVFTKPGEGICYSNRLCYSSTGADVIVGSATTEL